MSRKILIVEDSCDLREMLRTILTAYGWNPILAESGRKALDKLEHETPAIILMDMSMPDMSGFELATILKKHRVYKSIPHPCSDRVSGPYRPASVSCGGLR
jgi:Response regulator containing CheY-like receiver, AAA-type ATPase, and DNA-binding domains